MVLEGENGRKGDAGKAGRGGWEAKAERGGSIAQLWIRDAAGEPGSHLKDVTKLGAGA